MRSNHDRGATSGFHAVNIAHLVMGLVLLGGLGVWALVEGGVVEHDDLRWLLPVPWVVGGAVGLVAAAVTGPRRHAVKRSGWVGVGEAAPTPAGAPDPSPETAEEPTSPPS